MSVLLSTKLLPLLPHIERLVLLPTSIHPTFSWLSGTHETPHIFHYTFLPRVTVVGVLLLLLSPYLPLFSEAGMDLFFYFAYAGSRRRRQ